MELLRFALVLGGLLAAVPATATEWELSFDLRALSSDGARSFLDDGLGKLRFDEGDSGLRLGRLRAALTQPLGDQFALHADVSSWDGDDKNPIDLTEAYLEYRPYPAEGWRTRLRLGAFYPPFSLESRAAGWETPYTLTPSAIGAWLGEEIRTIGLEGQVEWLGTRQGHDFDLQLDAALFGWNDPAGTMLALHGFTLHDRQTTLFGRVGAAQSDPVATKKEVFHEMDDRPGYYVGAQARYLDRAVLQLLHYDNRADPTVRSDELRDFAWYTEFDAAAVRVETAGEWTLLLQALEGTTIIAPDRWLTWEFDSQSALLARGWHGHLFALRYDAFRVTFENQPAAWGSEDGHAWALAWSFEKDDRWRLGLEWLRVTSDVPARLALGEAPFATESKVEFSARYRLWGRF